MPTQKQLSQIWETEMEFPETRRDDDPAKPQVKPQPRRERCVACSMYARGVKSRIAFTHTCGK